MTTLNIQTAHFPPIPVAMIRHRGPYEGLSAEFDRLWAWVELNNVPAKRSIGIYYDNPDYVSAGQLRSAACVEVPAGYAIPSGGGAPVEPGTVAGGEYATLRFTGPYEELEKVWSGMTDHIERKMRRQIPDDIPAFEVYVNDPSDTPPSELITDLFMPVR